MDIVQMLVDWVLIIGMGSFVIGMIIGTLIAI